MSLYLTPKTVGGSMAVAICYRCQKKIYAGALKKDPNNQNYYCGECVDFYDPWRLPARRAEDISVQHPRTDEDVSVDDVIWDNGQAVWDLGLTVWS